MIYCPLLQNRMKFYFAAAEQPESRAVAFDRGHTRSAMQRKTLPAVYDGGCKSYYYDLQ